MQDKPTTSGECGVTDLPIKTECEANKFCDGTDCNLKTKKSKKLATKVKKKSEKGDNSYTHKIGHIFVKVLILILRLVGTILWCLYSSDCAINSSGPIVHLALAGLLPIDALVVAEFFFKKTRPFAVPLAHDILSILICAISAILLNSIGKCNFKTKGGSFVPTSIIAVVLLCSFHAVLLLCTYSAL